jgi:invasion protein IalB
MTGQRLRQFRSGSAFPLTTVLIIALHLGTGDTYGQQTAQPGGIGANEKADGQEFALRGQRMARGIKYGDWQKFCFKTPGTNMVCRTTISGTFETGQSAVRVDLIEREGDSGARLQLFVPVGLYLQAGVRITIDKGATYRIPYVWCLTNTCIAADLADPNLLRDMETGQTLVLEVADSSVLTVSTSLPLNQFAAVRQGSPTKVFEQNVDE